MKNFYAQSFTRPIKLESWSIWNEDDEPSDEGHIIKGRVYEHPALEDGSEIRVEHVLFVLGNVVATAEDAFLLCRPSTEFRNWFTRNHPGKKWNDKQPVRPLDAKIEWTPN